MFFRAVTLSYFVGVFLGVVGGSAVVASCRGDGLLSVGRLSAAWKRCGRSYCRFPGRISGLSVLEQRKACRW